MSFSKNTASDKDSSHVSEETLAPGKSSKLSKASLLHVHFRQFICASIIKCQVVILFGCGFDV